MTSICGEVDDIIQELLTLYGSNYILERNITNELLISYKPMSLIM